MIYTFCPCNPPLFNVAAACRDLGSFPLNVHAFRSSHICHAIRAIIDLVHIDAFLVKARPRVEYVLGLDFRQRPAACRAKPVRFDKTGIVWTTVLGVSARSVSHSQNHAGVHSSSFLFLHG